MASLTSGNASNGTHPMPVNIVHGTESQLILFLVLNMWPSHFGLPILLAIILFSKKVHRHPTFVNLCVGFIIIGISSTLLLYAGKITGPEPSKNVMSVPGIHVIWCTCFMFLVVRTSAQKRVSQGPQTARLWVMLGAPYAALLISILATATVGSANPDLVTRNRRYFYCSVDSSLLSGTIAAVGAVFLFATVVFEVWTLVILYKSWMVIRQPGAKPLVSIELSLPIRVLAFGLYVIVAMSLSLLSVKAPESPIPDLVIAFAATITILIFGTQPDIIRALCFWRKEPPTLIFNHVGSTAPTPSGDDYNKA